MQSYTRTITVVAVFAVAVTNVVVLWSQRRPQVQHVDRPTAVMQKVLEWEALPVNSLTDAPEKLLSDLKEYPHRASPDISRSLLVSFDDLSAAQRDDLFTTTVKLLDCYNKSDGAALVEYMQSRNEHLAPQFRMAALESLISSQIVDSSQSDTLSDKEIIEKAWTNEHCKTGWQGIVHREGSISVWRCDGCELKSMQTLGVSDNRLFQSQSISTHLFEPEWTFEQAHKQPGGVLMADVKILIQHDEKSKNERSPYFIRFWYSEADKLWHPFHFVHVNVRKPAQANSISLMF